MPQITIKTTAPLVRQGLEDLAKEIPLIGRRRLRTTTNRIVRRMQAYPAERAGQSISSSHAVLGTIFRAVRYRRTGNLGRSWTVTGRDNGYTIKNDARRKGKAYGKYVVGDSQGDGQAWMHAGRWQLFRNVVDDEVSKMPPEVSGDINSAARRRGL